MPLRLVALSHNLTPVKDGKRRYKYFPNMVSLLLKYLAVRGGGGGGVRNQMRGDFFPLGFL